MQSLFESEYFGTILSLIAGQFVPGLISFIKNKEWSDAQKMALTIGVCALVGVLTALGENALKVNGTLTIDDWLKNALAVYGSATAAYKIYFQDTRTNETLERIGPFADVSMPDVPPPPPFTPPIPPQGE
jgi:hypothetical protein